MVECECAAVHIRKRVVLTGGPGAGKTALLELLRQSFCEHVRVLPEAASIVFGGGFPRGNDLLNQRAAQRAHLPYTTRTGITRRWRQPRDGVVRSRNS